MYEYMLFNYLQYIALINAVTIERLNVVNIAIFSLKILLKKNIKFSLLFMSIIKQIYIMSSYQKDIKIKYIAYTHKTIIHCTIEFNTKLNDKTVSDPLWL